MHAPPRANRINEWPGPNQLGMPTGLDRNRDCNPDPDQNFGHGASLSTWLMRFAACPGPVPWEGVAKAPSWAVAGRKRNGVISCFLHFQSFAASENGGPPLNRVKHHLLRHPPGAVSRRSPHPTGFVTCCFWLYPLHVNISPRCTPLAPDSGVATRRDLLSDTIDAPRLPKYSRATGICQVAQMPVDTGAGLPPHS